MEEWERGHRVALSYRLNLSITQRWKTCVGCTDPKKPARLRGSHNLQDSQRPACGQKSSSYLRRRGCGGAACWLHKHFRGTAFTHDGGQLFSGMQLPWSQLCSGKQRHIRVPASSPNNLTRSASGT